MLPALVESWSTRGKRLLRFTVDERVILVEPEQSVRGEGIAIFAKDLGACIAGRLEQVEELDASLRCPTWRIWSMFNSPERIAALRVLVSTVG